MSWSVLILPVSSSMTPNRRSGNYGKLQASATFEGQCFGDESTQLFETLPLGSEFSE